MADEFNDRSDAGLTRIQPASIDLTTSAPAPAPERDQRRRLARSVLILAGFMLLVAAAGVVTFVLPRWTVRMVETREAATSSGEPAPVSEPAVPPPLPAAAASPWERAQESKLRKETQEILSQMLEAQKALEDHAVGRWAGPEFDAAMEDARSGDEFYNQRDFTNAGAEYTRALEQLKELVDRIEPLFEQTMAQGNAALEAGDSALAIRTYELLLAIDPLDRDAAIGMQRASTLDQVLDLVASGDRLLEQGDLETARDSYRQALDIDALSRPAQQGMQAAEERIMERDFNRHMSTGFAALENGHYEQARSAFLRAQQQKPKSPEVRTALAQTEQALTTRKISDLLVLGSTAESAEDWHGALSAYGSALELDASLAAALAGKERASTRARIHDRLEQTIADPKRLYDQAVYEDMRAFHAKLTLLADPGPVLTRQLRTLGGLLREAATPIPVRLHSDNLTRVTIYRVGELGMFQEKELTLLPGRYVAVGIREGYQDARREFFVEPDQPPQPITVIADQRISRGN